jgi:adenosylmethionine-8-amino-7-oxononanoate aminotransferase
VFITGTGTDVGKTTICAALIRGLSRKNLRVGYYKPVQTGNSDPDSTTIRNQCQSLPFIVPSTLSLEAPLSPDQALQAARKSDTSVADLANLLPDIQCSDSDWLVIEGAGGVQVPLNFRGETWVDYLRAVQLPVLVVARDMLGMINHTSLTILALDHAGISILGVVISGNENLQNVLSLRRLHPDIAFHVLPSFLGSAKATFSEDETASLAEFFLARMAIQAKELDPTDLVSTDINHVWHPYTQHKNAAPPDIVRFARGVNLELADGKRVLDGSASWWVNTVGHGRKEIGRAIVRQQQQLDHVIFANLSHKPAIELAERILQFSDSHLDRVFFSDNGSTAVEIALKMAYQACVNRGEPEKSVFLAFAGSYHGDTFGAMSIGKADTFHGIFRKILFRSVWANPVTIHKSEVCPRGLAAYDEYLADLRLTMESQQKTLAGVVIEPLVQGAGGMLMQPEKFLRDLASLCHEFQIPLIFDEVFSGMGRVGESFAFRRAKVRPDIVCLAKGLTGGTMPLALTLTTNDIFSSFLAEDRSKALLHGHSYTGNPIACAAALATLDIIKKEGLLARARELEGKFSNWLEGAQVRYAIENPRCLGGIFAFELPGSGFGNYFSTRAQSFTKLALSHGLFLRTLGNTAYFVPPLSITDAELALAFRGFDGALKGIGCGFR